MDLLCGEAAWQTGFTRMRRHNLLAMRLVIKMASKTMLRRCVLTVCQSLGYEIRDHLIKKRRKRSLWVRSWISRRNMLGASNLLLKELSAEDSEAYRLHLRMSPGLFEELLSRVSPMIQKNDTNMREALSPRLKLQVTLRFVASGDSYGSLEALYRVPKCTISGFIKDVMNAMYEALKEYIQVPQNCEQWEKIQDEFMLSWQFPYCCGALDGKHVYIQNPPHGASEYYNYKGRYSVVLLALVDANYRFIYIDVGKNGRMNDAHVFKTSSLSDALTNKTLNLPEKALFVADDAFPLRTEIMKPFRRSQPLDVTQKVFNYRLSRCRRVVENAFGILASRFRIFQRPLSLSLDKIDSAIRTCAVLHNWLRTNSSTYIVRGLLDEEDIITGVVAPGSWRSEPCSSGMSSIEFSTSSNNHTKAAAMVREKLADHFMGSGAVPWQNSYI